MEPRARFLTDRQKILLEIGAVLALWWMGTVTGGIDVVLGWPRSDFAEPRPLGLTYRLVTEGARVLLILYLIWRSGRRFEAFGFRRFRIVDLLGASGLWLAMVVTRYPFRAALHGLRTLPGAVIITHNHAGQSEFALWVSVIFAGFYEESLCRCYLCTRLSDLALSKWGVALISSLIFTLPHVYEGWLALPVIFAHGLLMAAVFLKTRSIWPVALAHASYNIFLYHHG